MKRREYFPDYEGRKRSLPREEISNDGWISDDSFKRKRFHKDPHAGHSAKWNDEFCEDSSYKDLCISYIPSRILNSDLEDGLLIEFEKYGRVSVKIINEGVDRRAYVRFIDSDDARRAYSSIEKNPLLLDNRKVEVKPCYKQIPSLDRPVKKSAQHESRSESHTGRYNKRSISPKSNTWKNSQFDDTEIAKKPISGLPPSIVMITPTRVLFVGNLPPGIKKNALQTMFETCGRIEKIDIKKNAHLGKIKTFAFIKFSNIDSAQKARDLFQNSYIEDRCCKIGFGHVDADVIREKEDNVNKRSEPPNKFKSLVVEPVPINCPASQLQDIFEGYGSMNIKMVTFDNKKVAYVNFQYPEDAQAAYKESQNLILVGHPVNVSLCYKPSSGDEKEKKFVDAKSQDPLDRSDNADEQRDTDEVKYMASATPTNMLFVGNLDSDVRKFDLMNTFSKFGSIDHIDIKEAKFGGAYAIVKFKSLSACKKANREMFGKKIGSHVCKIGYGCVAETGIQERPRKHAVNTEVESEEKKPQVTGLCFRFIPKAATDKQIKVIIQKKYKSFDKTGKMSVTIKMSGKYKVAFVYFESINQATKAWKAKINLSIMKKPVKISPIIMTKRTLHQKTEKKATTSSQADIVEPELDEKATRTLFIGNLPRDIQEKDLYNQFKEYGQIEFVNIKRTKGNASYAFIKYVNMDYAYKAKVEMNGKMFKDYKIHIGYGKTQVTSCLWVGGLGPWVDEETIRKEFSRFGDIRRMIWPKGSTYAYVQYEYNDAAEAACHKFHGWPMGGLDKRLRVDFVSVNQILTAIGKSKKSGSQDDDEHATDEDGDQCEVVSEVSMESDPASDSEAAMGSETAAAAAAAAESDAELSMSNISDDSYSEDFILTRSPSRPATSRSASVDSDRQFASVDSDHESVGDEERGVWAQSSEASLIIKTPFSPADEMSYSERMVFVQSKGRHADHDHHTHRQSQHRKPSPGARELLSPRRIDDSLQREIKHYRRESGIAKHSKDSYYKSASSSDDKHDDHKRYKGSYSKHGERHAYQAEERKREPGSKRYDSEQYVDVLAAKQYANKEYERRDDVHKHESDILRHDYVDREEKLKVSAVKLNDFGKMDYYGRRYEASHERLPQELPAEYGSKSIDYGHGIRDYSSDVREHVMAGVDVSPNVEGFKRPLQYDNPSDYQRPEPIRLPEQGPAAAYKNITSGSSSESLRTLNRVPGNLPGNPPGITSGNFEQRPHMFRYPGTWRPISYGDPSYGIRQEQPFQQQPVKYSSFVPVSTAGIQQLNTPRMMTPGQVLFPVAQSFPPTVNTNSNQPAQNRMSTAAASYNLANSFKMGRQGAERPYSMMDRQQRNQALPKGPVTLPPHIQR